MARFSWWFDWQTHGLLSSLPPPFSAGCANRSYLKNLSPPLAVQRVRHRCVILSLLFRFLPLASRTAFRRSRAASTSCSTLGTLDCICTILTRTLYCSRWLYWTCGGREEEAFLPLLLFARTTARRSHNPAGNVTDYCLSSTVGWREKNGYNTCARQTSELVNS